MGHRRREDFFKSRRPFIVGERKKPVSTTAFNGRRRRPPPAAAACLVRRRRRRRRAGPPRERKEQESNTHGGSRNIMIRSGEKKMTVAALPYTTSFFSPSFSTSCDGGNLSVYIFFPNVLLLLQRGKNIPQHYRGPDFHKKLYPTKKAPSRLPLLLLFPR